jgi:hypothetical protein
VLGHKHEKLWTLTAGIQRPQTKIGKQINHLTGRIMQEEEIHGPCDREAKTPKATTLARSTERLNTGVKADRGATVGSGPVSRAPKSEAAQNETRDERISWPQNGHPTRSRPAPHRKVKAGIRTHDREQRSTTLERRAPREPKVSRNRAKALCGAGAKLKTDTKNTASAGAHSLRTGK